MRYVMVLSLATGRATAHTPACAIARRKASFTKYAVEAPSVAEAARRFAEQEEHAGRAYRLPRFCRCAAHERATVGA